MNECVRKTHLNSQLSDATVTLKSIQLLKTVMNM